MSRLAQDGPKRASKHRLESLTSDEKVGLFLIVHAADNPFDELAHVYLIEGSMRGSCRT